MKKFLSILFFSFLFFDIVSKGESLPNLDFIDSRLVQYGDIEEGNVAYVNIRFKNTGDDRLIILEDFSTCNCTDVTYEKRVYEQGESGTISLTIDTEGKYGNQTIVVKLLTNTPQEYYIIRVDMNVL